MKNIWKMMLLILLEALCCHITLMGCYPFVAVLFFAVYMQELYRTAWIGFTYLFMALWLPMAELFRYGIAFLVWMVIMGIADRMQLRRRGFPQVVLGGGVLAFVSYGGEYLSAHGAQAELLPLLEAMMVAGMSFFCYRFLGVFLQWQLPPKKRELPMPLAEQMAGYHQAMEGLSRQLQALMEETAVSPGVNILKMRRELQNKICRSCEKQELCLAGDEGMAVTLEELLECVERRQPVEDSLKEKIFCQCQRAELLMQEATSVFEKMELNMSWYRRLCEHRELIAREIDAMAMVMEDCMKPEELRDDKEAWRLMQLRFGFRELGIKAEQLHLYQRKNRSLKIVADLSASRGTCVTSRELLSCLKRCFGVSFVSMEGNRGIVGREKSRYIFITETKLTCSYGVAKMVQEGQEISGDSFRAGQLEDGSFVMALSDGMGSGLAANRESESVVDLLMQFMEAGFTMEVALGLMNAAMIFGAEKERFSTLDVCLTDLYTGIVSFYKVGAHVSFIRHKNHVEVVDAQSLPMGAGQKIDVTPNRCYLAGGDYLVMITDGVLEYLQVEDPIESLKELLLEMTESDAASFSRKIMERMLLFTGGKVWDDMTVLTLKVQER